MADKDDKDKGGGAGDDFDKLPLSIIPLASERLKSSRLVKNTRLETMLELHNDPVSGSLQIRPEDIPKNFPGASKNDLDIIQKLSELKSYDVYSLRLSLKKLGIEVDPSALALSDEMKERLERYSAEFTRPLILHLFGDAEHHDIKDAQDFHRLFQAPNVALVQERLKNLSQKTGVAPSDLPAFLEHYRDLFLATLYYRNNFEALVPELNHLWLWLSDLKSQPEAAASAEGTASCRKVTGAFRALFISTRERLAKFRAAFDAFWSDTSPEAFARLKQEIEDNHLSMGAVLCGIGVKIRDWARAFPAGQRMDARSRLQYVMTELEPGLDQLTQMENVARQQIGMPAFSAPTAEEEAALRVLALFTVNFECLAGDVVSYSLLLKAWEAQERASGLDLRKGLDYAQKQEWLRMTKKEIYQITDAGFEKAMSALTRAS